MLDSRHCPCTSTNKTGDSCKFSHSTVAASLPPDHSAYVARAPRYGQPRARERLTPVAVKRRRLSQTLTQTPYRIFLQELLASLYGLSFAVKRDGYLCRNCYDCEIAFRGSLTSVSPSDLHVHIGASLVCHLRLCKLTRSITS